MTVVAGKRRRGADDGDVQRLNVFISPEAHKGSPHETDYKARQGWDLSG
jgi:hypothetical protein